MIKGKKVVATIQARMTSSRLPGKVLMDLVGRPVLAHMIERHRRSKFTDEVVVATTINKTDDPIIELCKKMNCPFYRGNENDVLSRVTEAVEKSNAEIVVQGMADSPLVDWRIVDHLVEMLVDGDYDYASNELEPSFPVGLDARAFLFSALKKSEEEAEEDMYREHAGFYIYKHPDIFKLVNWKAPKEMFWPDLRLTLDTEEDYKLIQSVYNELFSKNNDFSGEDIVNFLRKRPDLVAINAEVEQKIPSVNK